MNSPDHSSNRSCWTLHRLSPWIALAATLLLIAFLEVRRQPPDPVPAHAPPDVFSAERAFDALRTILGADERGAIEIHPTGSRAADRVRDRIVDELIARGVAADAIEIHQTVACRDSARWSYVGCTPVKNIVATLPGPSAIPTDGPALLLMSHYDSVGAGPGVSDDAVGVAAMLETVRALLEADPGGAQREHPVVVLVTDAEEVGLFGARGFVDRHPLATEGRVGAVLNLEARGTGGQSLLFQASEDDAWIVDAYREAVRRMALRPATSSLYAEVYRRLPNDTDLSVFLGAGIVGINFAYAEGVQRYHTPQDDLEHLDRGSLQHHGDHLLAMTRQLASDPRLGDPPAGRAVYTDIASLFLLAYPATWALPLAVLAFLGVFGLVAVAVRRTECCPNEIFVAMLGLLACAVASVGLAWLLGELVQQLSGTQRPGWAHPTPLRTGLWALVFLVPAALGWVPRRFRRLRAGDAALTLAPWLLLGLLAVVFAVTVPGVSIFATLPALVAVALGGIASWRRSDRARDAARLAVALATAFFWFTIARGLEMGMGLHLTALVAAPLAICAWPFAVYVRAESARNLRWALAAAVLIGLVGAIWVAPYSPTKPLGVNVIHFESHDADGLSEDWEVNATIWVDSGADVPPDELMAAAGLDPEPERAPDRLRLGSAYRGETSPEYLEPPRLEVLDAQTIEVQALDAQNEGSVQRVVFRIVGPEADFLRLYLPKDAELRSVEVAGYDIDMAGREVPGAHLLSCTGPDCDGVEFTVELGGSEPVAGELYAIRYGSVAGLPDTARIVADSRPDWAVPVHSGDRVAVRVGVSLP